MAEFIKKTKSVQWLNMYMNDIGDQVCKTPLCSSCFGARFARFDDVSWDLPD